MLTLYFVQAGAAGPIKIGVAQDVQRRVAQLQTGHYEKLTILATLRYVDLLTERRVHGWLAKYRIRGEWFMPHPDVLRTAFEHAEMDTFLTDEAIELAEQCAAQGYC
jgi:hypothetical protein